MPLRYQNISKKIENLKWTYTKETVQKTRSFQTLNRLTIIIH